MSLESAAVVAEDVGWNEKKTGSVEFARSVFSRLLYLVPNLGKAALAASSITRLSPTELSVVNLNCG